jgi:hypothetical protein
MNCPFCDESIHPTSKFCPKCGLPLKEDATVMGAYVSDDSGMNPWVIGAGALGIVGIALGIGWFTGRKNEPVQTVRREPVGSYTAPARNYTPSYASFGNGGGAINSYASFAQSRASVQPFVPNVPVKWAWEPPKTPAQPVNQAPVPAAIADPEPPRVPLVHIVRRENQQRPEVKVVQAEIPQIPSFPMPALPAARPSFGVEPTAQVETSQAGAFNGFAVAAHNFNETQPWVWDPVHERWARRTSYKPGRSSVTVRDGRSRPAAAPSAAGVQQAPSAARESLPLDNSQVEQPEMPEVPDSAQ